MKALILLALIAMPLKAEDFLLPRSQFNVINLTLPQSLVSAKESNISGNGNYESLARAPQTDFLRLLSRPVGRLNILYEKGASTCTASVVSDKYVLTNYHCIPGDGGHGKVEQASIMLGYFSVVDTSTVKKYTVAPTPVIADEELDVALLEVKGNPASEWGAITLEPRDPYPGESLLVVHHPLGQPLHVTRGHCRAYSPTSVGNSDVFHTCDTEAGSSGAPILTSDGKSVIGIHFSGAFGQLSANRGKRVFAIMEKYAVFKSFVQPAANQVAIAKTFSLTASHPQETVFLKSSYTSVAQMDAAGCESVKSLARQQAKSMCSDAGQRLDDITYDSCTSDGRAVRRYQVQAKAQCVP